jgi:PAS domain S-box-containing protein
LFEHSTFVGAYDYRLVALSILIAFFSAYAAIDLAGRIASATGTGRLSWLAGGSFAVGTGIWTMHYIGIAAYRLPVPVSYDWKMLVLSLLIAMASSGAALSLASGSKMDSLRAIPGCLILGCGFAAMHYIGVEAMHLPAVYVYSTPLVVLSVALSIGASYAVLNLVFRLREESFSHRWQKFSGALMLGCALPLMHYVAMASVTFLRTEPLHRGVAHAINLSNVDSIRITFIALMALGFASICSMLDRRYNQSLRVVADSRLQLQAIFDNMTEGVVVLDQKRNLVHINVAAASLLGLAKASMATEELQNKFDVFLPDGQPLPQDKWPSVLALRGEFASNEILLIQQKNGTRKVIAEISTAPIRNSKGETVQVIICYRDITESTEVNRARLQLAAIVDSSEDGIISKDCMGVVKSWNRGAQRIFGYTAEEMIGQSIRRLLPAGFEAEEEEILRRIRKGESVDHIETTRKRKDGSLIDISLSISPIHAPDGSVIGASKIARDISDKKQLERQLRQSQKMEAVGQLTGGVAHDFNNLLGVIMGNLDLLERLVEKDEKAMMRVTTAQKATLRGAELTRKLLAFSSKDELQPTEVILNDCIDNAIEFARPGLGPDVKIVTHLKDPLPYIFVDATGLENALLNLVVNARDAMPMGGLITLTSKLTTIEADYPPVQTGEMREGEYACVTVADTGHGMTREVMDRAFEPFFTTKTRDKGTGLGLALVYGFAKQCGGTVRIYSEPGYGTTVSLYLPIERRSSLRAPQAEPVEVTQPARKGSILIVDDEEDLLDIAAEYLKDMGHKTLQALDGASALKVIREDSDIDLMVTDIVMPGGMNGVELAQKARALRPLIRILYTSGFPADALAEKEMPLMDGPLLHKPYQRAEFDAAVKRVMGVDSQKQPKANTEKTEITR